MTATQKRCPRCGEPRDAVKEFRRWINGAWAMTRDCSTCLSRDARADNDRIAARRAIYGGAQ